MTSSQHFSKGAGLSDSMIEISRTLENLKGNRLSLEKEIENEEIYKEKLIEKLKSYQSELMRINGT